MAFAYSFTPLRTRPFLIPACVNLLRNEWPHCRAELLPKLVKLEQSHVPCSYCMVEHHPTENSHRHDVLVAHFRMVAVVNSPRSVFFEAMCIDNAKRRCGFGRKVLACAKEHARRLGYHDVYFRSAWSLKDYYAGTYCELHNKPLVRAIGANMLGIVTKYPSWLNMPYPGPELFNDTRDTTPDEKLAEALSEHCWFVKRLGLDYDATPFCDVKLPDLENELGKTKI